jgi:hypothetical protein
MEKNCKTCQLASKYTTDSSFCVNCRINHYNRYHPTDSVVSQERGKREMFEKVYVNGKKENLPKEAGTYIVCKKSGEIYRDWRYISIDGDSPDAKMWLNRIDWWLRPVE